MSTTLAPEIVPLTAVDERHAASGRPCTSSKGLRERRVDAAASSACTRTGYDGKCFRRDWGEEKAARGSSRRSSR